jgi:glycosyltransferase involved in cell wall biosynthesis
MTIEGDESERPEVSVVLPARNVEALLPLQLDALALQDLDRCWEVLVADNGSTDSTADVVRQAAGSFPVSLRLVDASRAPGINVARNEGVAAARGDLIAFCDGDDIVGEGWLANLITGLARFDFVGGRLEFESLNDPTTAAWRLRGAPGLQTWRGITFPTGGNFAGRRNCIDELGGFDERFVLGYCEAELVYRAHVSGMTLGFVPDAPVHYRLRGSSRDLARQRFSYGRGCAILLSTHPELRDPRVDGVWPRTRAIARLLARIAKRATRPGTEREALLVNLAAEIGVVYQQLAARVPRRLLRL